MKPTLKVKMLAGARAGQEIELPNEAASNMIYAGLASLVEDGSKKKRALGDARWFVEGEDRKARITSACPVCGQSEVTYGVPRKGFRHCGKTEVVPKEVVAWYQRARNTFV
jgi:hypothetical protein